MKPAIHTFTIPATLRNGGPGKVGLRQLTADQELMASKVGRFDVMKTQYEAAKLAIAEFDGKPANYADGDVDKFWEGGGPKLRALLLQAYNHMASPSTEEEASFLSSEAISVGDH
jgi:hypothetical protein